MVLELIQMIEWALKCLFIGFFYEFSFEC